MTSTVNLGLYSVLSPITSMLSTLLDKTCRESVTGTTGRPEPHSPPLEDASETNLRIRFLSWINNWFGFFYFKNN